MCAILFIFSLSTILLECRINTMPLIQEQLSPWFYFGRNSYTKDTSLSDVKCAFFWNK